MLRTFCGTEDTSPKSNLRKEKNRPANPSEKRMSLAERDLAIASPKARGLNPCPWLGRERRDFTYDRP